MTVTYDDASHAYTVDGVRVPSVTEIAGILTAGKYAEGNPAALAQAQRRGTEVHEICQQIDCGIDPEELEIPPELTGYVNGYLAFLRDWGPEWDYMEKIVYTRDYAGRADRIGRIDGKTAVVDIKTTAVMDRLSKLALLAQLQGYGEAWQDMGNPPVFHRLGVQLKHNGRYTLHWGWKIEDKYLDADTTAAGLFTNCLALARLIGGYE